MPDDAGAARRVRGPARRGGPGAGPIALSIRRRARSTGRPNNGRSQMPTMLPKKGEHEPQPAMQAGGSDAAEICPDIAAIGEPRAVAHHQAAEQRGEERPAAPPRRRTAPWRAGGLKR